MKVRAGIVFKHFSTENLLEFGCRISGNSYGILLEFSLTSGHGEYSFYPPMHTTIRLYCLF